MPAKGYTVSELAELTKKTRHAVESWLSTHAIKPLSYEAIYPTDTLELLLNAKVGRPTKTEAGRTGRPAKKPKAPDTSQ